MKNFCQDLRELATEIISYEKKEMMPLTAEEKKMHNEQKVCYIRKKVFKLVMTIKNIIKYEIIVIIL